MTEDDTFRKLKQTPIRQVIELMKQPMAMKNRKSILEANGYTYKEYQTTLVKEMIDTWGINEDIKEP